MGCHWLLALLCSKTPPQRFVILKYAVGIIITCCSTQSYSVKMQISRSIPHAVIPLIWGKWYRNIYSISFQQVLPHVQCVVIAFTHHCPLLFSCPPLSTSSSSQPFPLYSCLWLYVCRAGAGNHSLHMLMTAAAACCIQKTVSLPHPFHLALSMSASSFLILSDPWRRQIYVFLFHFRQNLFLHIVHLTVTQNI